MTQAQAFVEWVKDHAKYTSDVDELLGDYFEETGCDSVEVDRGETGDERRWDREVQRVDRFLDDGSFVISTFWEPLQYDHADGIYPDPSFYVGRAVEVTVTKYERIGS